MYEIYGTIFEKSEKIYWLKKATSGRGIIGGGWRNEGIIKYV